MAPRFRLKFFCEWGGGPCLWADNDNARARFDVGGVDYGQLGLSLDTVELANRLCDWHDQSLNRDYPPDPGPWRQDECDRFNAAARDLLERIRRELGEEFEVIDHQWELGEDPDLDAYLKNPKGFRR